MHNAPSPPDKEIGKQSNGGGGFMTQSAGEGHKKPVKADTVKSQHPSTTHLLVLLIEGTEFALKSCVHLLRIQCYLQRDK